MTEFGAQFGAGFGVRSKYVKAEEGVTNEERPRGSPAMALLNSSRLLTVNDNTPVPQILEYYFDFLA